MSLHVGLTILPTMPLWRLIQEWPHKDGLFANKSEATEWSTIVLRSGVPFQAIYMSNISERCHFSACFGGFAPLLRKRFFQSELD